MRQLFFIYLFSRNNTHNKGKILNGKLRLYLVTVFVFYFQKHIFGNIKKKQFSCIFEIKNMFGQLKLKRQFFEEEKIENTKICCYQDLNFDVNSLNKTDSLN